MKIALINCSPKLKNSASGVILQGLKKYLGETETEHTVCEFRIRIRDTEKMELESILSCDVLVFSMPLYVDGVPSHVVEALTAFEQLAGRTAERTAARTATQTAERTDEQTAARAAERSSEKPPDRTDEYLAHKAATNAARTIYAIVNCGFHEGHQSKVALRIMKNWCIRMGCRWGRGLGVGGGGMVGELNSVPMGKGPKRTLGMELQELARIIVSEELAQATVSKEPEPGDTRYIAVNFPRFLYRTAAQYGWRKQLKQAGLKKKELFTHPDNLRREK